MNIDATLIPIAIALVALCVPWLYDGSLFTRHGEVIRHRAPLDKDEVRQRAKRRL